MGRSKTVFGPYEIHPDNYLVTSKDAPGAVLQRAGHGQYVETRDGEAYVTHLLGRPLPPHRRCTLGRETGIQKITWHADGWPRLAHGSMVPAVKVPAPGAAKTVERAATVSYGFDESTLHPDFQWLRTPEPERLFSTTARPGHLRLTGRESMGSWFEFALVARRQEDHSFRAETVLDFSPGTYQQVAGLTHYYNRYKFHAIGITLHERLGRVLVIQSCAGEYPSGKLSFPVDSGVAVSDGRIDLAVEVRDNDLQFFWRAQGESDWTAIGPVLDGGVVSDEGGVGEHGSFTGAFVGMFAYDITGSGKAADFDGFSYTRL